MLPPAAETDLPLYSGRTYQPGGRRVKGPPRTARRIQRWRGEELTKVGRTTTQEAGCRHVQVDEPLFAAVSVPRSRRRSAPSTKHARTSTCSSGCTSARATTSSARSSTNSDQVRPTLLRLRRVPGWPDLPHLVQRAVMIEYDFAVAYESVLRERQLAIGAADVQNKQIETSEQIIERIQAQRWLSPEQTLITTSCGLNHLSREAAFGKLNTIADASATLRGDRALPNPFCSTSQPAFRSPPLLTHYDLLWQEAVADGMLLA